jgi:hypothetical protein
MCVVEKYMSRNPKDFEGMSEIAIQMWQWVCRRWVVDSNVPPEILSGPGRAIGARSHLEAHVNRLVESYASAATVAKHGVGICIDDDLAEQHDDFKNLTLEDCVDANAGVGMITADHNRLAQGIYNVKYPLNKITALMAVRVLVGADNAETRRMCRLYGNLDNFKGEGQLKRDWISLIEMMHRQIESELELVDAAIAAQAVKIAKLEKVGKRFRGKLIKSVMPQGKMAQMKTDWAYSTGIPSQTIGSLCQIASKRGELWDVLWDVINGFNCAKPKTFKKPGSAGVFNTMGSVPEDVVLTYLRNVLGGRWTCAAFRRECTIYKKTLVVREEIMANLKLIKKSGGVPADFELPTDWAELGEMMPSLASDLFVANYVKVAMTVGMGSSDQLYEDCLRVMRSYCQTNSNTEPEVSYRVDIFVHTLLRYCTFCYILLRASYG